MIFGFVIYLIVGFLICYGYVLYKFANLYTKFGGDIAMKAAYNVKNTAFTGRSKKEIVFSILANIVLWPVLMPTQLSKTLADLEQEMEYLSSKKF